MSQEQKEKSPEICQNVVDGSIGGRTVISVVCGFKVIGLLRLSVYYVSRWRYSAQYNGPPRHSTAGNADPVQRGACSQYFDTL